MSKNIKKWYIENVEEFSISPFVYSNELTNKIEPLIKINTVSIQKTNKIWHFAIHIAEKRSWNEIVKNPKIWLDWFLWPIRRIDRARNLYKQDGLDDNWSIDIYKPIFKHDNRHISLQTFFHNAYCLIQIINEVFIPLEQKNTNIEKGIQFIRDLFAHEYSFFPDKDLYPDKNYLITLAPNHKAENEGIFEFKLYDLKTKKYKRSIYFWLPFYINYIINILEEIYNENIDSLLKV